ncbi:MAG: hypothetical protein IPM16_13150 [Chloroflexi bacterium]|nr:hypothetical protein [Chloroflexota bacterium]
MSFQQKVKTDQDGFGAHDADPNSRRMTGALILIALGVVFLAMQSGWIELTGNWWAIFIAVPACVVLYNAYDGYRRAGRFTYDVGNRLGAGINLGGIAILVALNRFEYILPFLLISLGMLIALGWVRATQDRTDE